ncbi:MAG: YihA family ribosome biogenesis GTP-binding protein [Candidatus Obscuribacterales bacterium]|nr:YihA family ribosome biogenesis GTP-binding protein [Steroidobacteraceae bacterium]
MLFPSAQFLLGAHQPNQFPADDGVEVAVAGRSNAGKSSALNAIVARNALARTSKTPGRTQQINFFEFRRGCRVVDLPGYGFAKVPVPMRRHWQALLSAYFADRLSLRGVIQIMDIRHPLTDFDIRLLELANERGLPVHVLLTKADKLSRSQAMQTLKQVKAALEGASIQLFSAVTKAGVDDARKALEEMWTLDAAEVETQPK